MIRTRNVVATFSTAALVASLGACKPEHPAAPTASTIPALGPLDPTAGAPAYPPVPAPPVPAPAVPAPAAGAYAYPQRAYAMSRTIHQRPPSYAFGYGGEEPWAWDEGDEGTMVAEPFDDGYRYYYYAPDATYPYFVQDPGYGYAYSPDGVLIGLFAATGALIAADRWRDEAPYAASYWNRGYDLDRARHGGRHPVPPRVWRAQAPALYAGPERWFQAAQAQRAWRGEGHGPQPWRGAAGPAVAAAHRQPAAGDFRDPPRAAPHLGPSQIRIEHGEPRHDAARPPGAERGHGSAGPGPHVQPHGPGSKGGHAPMAWREAHAGGQPHPARAPGHRAGQGGQAFAHVSQPHGGNPPGGGGNHGAPHGWSHGGGGQGNGGHGAVRVSQAHGPGGGSGHGGVSPGHGGAGHGNPGHGNPGHGNPGQGKAGHGGGGGGGHGRH